MVVALRWANVSHGGIVLEFCSTRNVLQHGSGEALGVAAALPGVAILVCATNIYLKFEG
jgi:hypothetical protein